MLALLRSRRLFTPVPPRQTRSIQSTPREIPPYLERWGPSLHKSPHTPLLSVEANKLQNVAPDVARLEEWLRQREELRDKKLVDSRNKRQSVTDLIRLLHLPEARASPSLDLSTQLWDAYRVATNLDPTLRLRIPKPDWEIMWNAQYAHGWSRANHLPILERDMRFAGVTTVGQRVRYLEDLFSTGKEEDALRVWEDDHSRPVPVLRQAHTPEHLEVGVRLHALAGNTDRARQVMKELFEVYPNSNPSIIMSVFRAHTRSETKEKHDVANELYLEMKERMGTDFTLETYDACLVGFIEARCLQHAKQVFRDMCKNGRLSTSGDVQSIGEVLERLHLLYRLGTDISKMTSIILDVISTLPESYHGHVFSSWMQSAVIEKAPEAAAQILDMMFQRGLQSETFHFNMLLRALLRSGESSKILEAENIGWRMVERAKLEAIEADYIPNGPARYIERQFKNNELATGGSQRAVASEASATIAVPRASKSTFGIIMQHHADNLQWEHVDYLARQLKEAGVRPNTLIMNVIIDSRCKQGRFSEAWTTYRSLCDKRGARNLFPDGRTMRLLWKTLRIALSEQREASSEPSGLPTPRALLAETVRWWDMCRGRHDAERFLQGLAGKDHGAIMGLMMHCFSFVGDLPGSFVAVHVLRHKFKIIPVDKTFDIIQRQMVWKDLRNETDAVRAQWVPSGAHARRTRYVEALFQDLLEQRSKMMNAGNDTESNLSQEELGDIRLNFLAEFVKVFMEGTYEPAIVEAMIDAVKNEVGVPDT